MSSFAKLVPSCLLVASVLGASSSAFAQTYCFPNAIGVPGKTGAPTSITDPRWNGALAFGQGDGKVEFRALTHVVSGQKTLVLTWHVHGDFGLADNVDKFMAGFLDDSTNPPTGNLMMLQRKAISPTTGGTVASGALSARIYRYNGTATAADWVLLAEEGYAAPVGTLPSWLRSATLTDLECGVDGCPSWTVTLSVPLSATATQLDPGTGIKLVNRYRFSYQAEIHQPLIPAVERYVWPEGIEAIDFDLPSFPAPNVLARIQSPGGPDPCSTGISLTSSQITVDHGGVTAGRQISLSTPNVFHARPTNGLSVPVPAGAVEASFRIADFSTQGQPALWDAVPEPSCSAAHSATATAVPAGGQFDLTCSWTLTQEQKCRYARSLQPAGACDAVPVINDRSMHQCVFVELRNATGGGVVLPAGMFFSKQSAYQNMDFVNASSFSRATRIDARVLPVGASPAIRFRPRDTYLFVETKNMPAARKPAGNGPQLAVARPEVLAAIRAPEVAKQLEKLGAHQGKVGADVSAVLREELRKGRVTEREIAAVMPTYVVHVYRDTGRVVDIDGKKVKVLTSLPSFGYFVAHDGPLVGWKYGIKGARQVGPNLYRLTVPASAKGGARIESWLQACENAACK